MSDEYHGVVWFAKHVCRRCAEYDNCEKNGNLANERCILAQLVKQMRHIVHRHGGECCCMGD